MTGFGGGFDPECRWGGKSTRSARFLIVRIPDHDVRILSGSPSLRPRRPCSSTSSNLPTFYVDVIEAGGLPVRRQAGEWGQDLAIQKPHKHMPGEKHVAHFRFYGSLNDFLSGRGGGTGAAVRYAFWGVPAIKDAIEAQGVPHPEVDLVLVDETPVSFGHSLSARDRVSVYPWIQSLPRPTSTLRPSLPRPLRLVCDVHLGQLARYLRMLGLDAHYDTERSDAALARISDEEDRMLLTRDVGLLQRSRVKLGAFVRAQASRRQLAEVARRFELADDAVPFTRCLECNVELGPAPPEAVDEQVPPRAQEAHDAFVQCPSCTSVYWAGTHVERMKQLIADVTPASGNISESDSFLHL